MRYRRIVLVIFIILVGASLIYALMDQRRVTTSSEKAYQSYLRGDDFMNRLYYQEALSEFENAVSIDPNFAMAYARMAMLYMSFDRQKEYREAKTRALALLPKVKEKERIVINLMLARSDGRMDDLERCAEELIAKYPDSFEAHEFKATRFFSRREYPKTIEENLEILKKYPNYAIAYNILAYSSYYLREYDKALEYIDKYTELAQDQANPLDSRGELLLNMGHYDEALVQFRKADSIKSGLYFVVAHMGAAYRAKGMYRDAIGAYLKAGEISPNERMKANIDGDIAMCYIELEQHDKAIEMLKEVLVKIPDDLKANAFLGGIYADRGQMEDALVQLGIIKGIVANADQPGKLDEMNRLTIMNADRYLNGKIAFARGDYQTGLKYYEELYTQTPLPDKIVFAGLYGEALNNAGMPDSAFEIASAGLRDNPNSGACLMVLADACGKTGRAEAQKDALLRYMSIMKSADEGVPDVAHASANLGQINRKAL